MPEEPVPEPTTPTTTPTSAAPIEDVPPTFITETPTATTTVPGTVYETNLAFAKEKNAEFSTLTPTSACTVVGEPACIDGDFATCGEDGTYRLSPCEAGMSCFAIPWEFADLVKVGCWDTGDAERILDAGTGGETPSATPDVPAPEVPTEPSSQPPPPPPPSPTAPSDSTTTLTTLITRTVLPSPDPQPDPQPEPEPEPTPEPEPRPEPEPEPSTRDPAPVDPTSIIDEEPPTFTTILDTIQPGPSDPTPDVPPPPPATTTTTSSTSKWTNIVPIDEPTTNVVEQPPAPTPTTVDEGDQPTVEDNGPAPEEQGPAADATTVHVVEGASTVSLYFTVTVTEKERETVTATLIIPG